jgi:transcriptional regulator with XRE-family HTH domain
MAIMEFHRESSDAAILQEFGARLARQRLNRNQTQAALAHEAGVSPRTLHRIEHGHSAQAVQWIRLLRALDLLENLEALLPSPTPSPLQQVQRRGKPRRRASSPTEQPADGKPWTWGDAE